MTCLIIEQWISLWIPNMVKMFNFIWKSLYKQSFCYCEVFNRTMSSDEIYNFINDKVLNPYWSMFAVRFSKDENQM